MARTTAVSNGWMTLVRTSGTILPVALAMMSMRPRLAHNNAMQKTAMTVADIARPVGEGGVSTISSAAGRNASSSVLRVPPVHAAGMSRLTNR